MIKVAIIGAGPAGLSCALHFARSSKNFIVHLYDKTKIGENIICGEGLFKPLPFDLPDLMKVSKFIIKDYQIYEINLPESSNFATFSRKRWQIGLAEQCEKMGVKIFENFKIDRNKLPDLQKEYDYVFDGSGVYGVSHDLLPEKELNKYRKNLVPAVQMELEGDFSKFDGQLLVQIFNNPPGYFWFFPRKRDNKITIANAGLGRLVKKKRVSSNLKVELDHIVSNLLNDYNILSSKVSVIPTRRIKSYLVTNVIILGDALGLCSPLHGGGIDTAVFSGFYAAEAVLKGNFKIYEDYLAGLDKRFFLERIILRLWEKRGSALVLNRLKNKGLLSKDAGIILSEDWLKRALKKIIL